MTKLIVAFNTFVKALKRTISEKEFDVTWSVLPLHVSSHVCIEAKKAKLFIMLSPSCVEAEHLIVLLPIGYLNLTENYMLFNILTFLKTNNFYCP